MDAKKVCLAHGINFKVEKAATYRPYKKHEFCKAMNCSWFQHGACTLKPGCSYSARQLHSWLDDNGFKIVRQK